jgi:hypothetical protein
LKNKVEKIEKNGKDSIFIDIINYWQKENNRKRWFSDFSNTSNFRYRRIISIWILIEMATQVAAHLWYAFDFFVIVFGYHLRRKQQQVKALVSA